MLSVLLVEDDPMVRQVNEQFIEKVPGFEVIAIATNGLEGVQKAATLQPDLVFMDVFMPQLNGIESLRQIRQKGLAVDVIAITAANDAQTIEKIVHLGVFDYIMKPFSFERLHTALTRYRQFKQKTAHKDAFSQTELDELLQHHSEHAHHEKELPKGLNKATLDKIIAYIDTQKEAVSAEQVANGVGLARVTARRYLDYLEKQHVVEINIQYGGVGRPINQYRLLPYTT